MNSVKTWKKMFFLLSRAWDKEHLSLFRYAELKIYHLSYSIYSTSKHDAIDMADPSSMQDACHI